MIGTIPLNKLVPSPRNVRRTTDEQGDLQLKADIEARELLGDLIIDTKDSTSSGSHSYW